MNRQMLLRGASALLGGTIASLSVQAVLVLLGRWADGVHPGRVSDPLTLLYLALGSGEGAGATVVVSAGLLAAVLSAWIGGASAGRPLAGMLAACVVGPVVAAGMIGGVLFGWLSTTPDWRSQSAHVRWWITDDQPPSLTIITPAAPARGGPLVIGIETSDAGDHRIASVTISGRPYLPAAQIVVDVTALPDGEHTVVVDVEDASRQRNRAQARAVFRNETQWWLSDTRPPTITLTIPSGVSQGVVAVAVALADEGEHHLATVTLDGAATSLATLARLDTRQLVDGEHTLLVEAEDASRQRNRAQARAVFRTDNRPPEVTLRFDPVEAAQGHAQVIYVAINEATSSVTATLGGRPLALAAGEQGYWAVVGFAADAAVGAQILDTRAVDLVGHATQATATQVITAFAFPIENVRGETINVPADKVYLLDPAVGSAEIARLDTVFSIVSPQPLWSGLFTVPVAGRQTSPFAIRRSYNGGPLGSFHGGADIAANAGAPVAAANRGRVVLAEALQVRGLAVILDHGLGVYSAYYHLSDTRVQKGQMVDKGQVIGLVGSTGLSTGPHLHWEMRASGKAVDPWAWTRRTYP